jgi:hypothetical protein
MIAVSIGGWGLELLLPALVIGGLLSLQLIVVAVCVLVESLRPEVFSQRAVQVTKDRR